MRNCNQNIEPKHSKKYTDFAGRCNIIIKIKTKQKKNNL